MLDVMIAVGGITDFADGNRATLLRTSEGNKQYSVRLKDLVKRGDVSANVELESGDVLTGSAELVLNFHLISPGPSAGEAAFGFSQWKIY